MYRDQMKDRLLEIRDDEIIVESLMETFTDVLLLDISFYQYQWLVALMSLPASYVMIYSTDMLHRCRCLETCEEVFGDHAAHAGYVMFTYLSKEYIALGPSIQIEM